MKYCRSVLWLTMDVRYLSTHKCKKVSYYKDKMTVRGRTGDRDQESPSLVITLARQDKSGSMGLKTSPTAKRPTRPTQGRDKTSVRPGQVRI